MTDTFKETFAFERNENKEEYAARLLTQIAQEVRQEPTLNGTLLKLNVLSILSRHGAKISEEKV